MRIATLLAPLLFLALGCSSFQKPTVSVRTMTLREVTAAGFTMDFATEIDNPNPVSLPLADTDYALQLAGVRVLSGAAKPGGTLPARGRLAVNLPVMLSFDDLINAEAAIRKSGARVPFSLDATFGFGGGSALLGQGVKVPVTYAGTLDLRAALADPAAILRSPVVRRLLQGLIGG